MLASRILPAESMRMVQLPYIPRYIGCSCEMNVAYATCTSTTRIYCTSTPTGTFRSEEWKNMRLFKFFRPCFSEIRMRSWGMIVWGIANASEDSFNGTQVTCIPTVTALPVFVDDITHSHVRHIKILSPAIRSTEVEEDHLHLSHSISLNSKPTTNDASSIAYFDFEKDQELPILRSLCQLLWLCQSRRNSAPKWLFTARIGWLLVRLWRILVHETRY